MAHHGKYLVVEAGGISLIFLKSSEWPDLYPGSERGAGGIHASYSMHSVYGHGGAGGDGTSEMGSIGTGIYVPYVMPR